MTIEELKIKIENKTVSNDCLIFKYQDTDFIAIQYAKEIAKQHQLQLEYVESLNIFKSSIFGDVVDSNKLYVYKVNELKSSELISHTNLIIVTHKTNIKDAIIIPKLDDWMITDYACSLCSGISEKDMNTLINKCGKNLYRLDIELDKIRLFSSSEQPYVFKDFMSDGIFGKESSETIFDLTNAIQIKDKSTIIRILKNIQNIDVEPIGLLTLLYNNFRKMISVWLHPNPTEVTTGIPQKQIWAISKIPKKYSMNELIKCFSFISEIDYKFKTGELSEDILVDYLICKILSIN